MRSHHRPIARRLAVATAALALAAAACGSDDDESATTEAPATDPPVTHPPATDPAVTEPPATDPPATEPLATDPPADASAGEALRIVSLSPTHTEMLFAIEADDLLVAVDDQSNFPAEALELPNDLSGFEPNVEAIADFEPDLVVIGGDFTGLGDQLADLGINSWDGPAASTIDDTYSQIEQLGDLTGHPDEAAGLVASMQSDIAAIVEAAPILDAPLSFYHELDPSYFSADSTSFIGELYSLLGLVNIADEAPGDNFGFPQLNAEFIVDANPELIFLADTKCCGESADTVAARPGWDAIAAVQNGNVIEMDDDIASRWGPRVVDYLAEVAAAVDQAVGAGG